MPLPVLGPYGASAQAGYRCVPMETEPQVMDLTVACVTSVKNATGLELDLSQDTLPVLDHYAQIVESPREEIVSLVAPMCGAYFGELVRRHLGEGEWVHVDDPYEAWRLELAEAALSFNPIGVALEALVRTEAGGWGAHVVVPPARRKIVDEALAVYGAVAEDDYYRFSVRFEGIEQAFHALVNNPKGMAPDP